MHRSDQQRKRTTRGSFPRFFRITSFAWFGLLLGSPILSAQDAPPDSNPATLRQREVVQSLAELEGAAAEKNWSRAVELFDAVWKLASRGEDILVLPTGTDVNQLRPGENSVAPGARGRLRAFLRSADPALRREYERQFGPIAAARLTEAVQSGSTTGLRDVASRYQLTAAGRVASRLLTRRLLGQGRPAEAADQLLRVDADGGAADQSNTKLRAALLFWSAGRSEEAESLMAQLAAEASPPQADDINWGSADARRKWLISRSGISGNQNADDWLQPGGTARRIQNQSLGPIRFRTDWSHNLFHSHYAAAFPLFSDLNPFLSAVREGIRRNHLAAMQSRIAAIPVTRLLRVDGLLVFRTITGMAAIDEASGAIVWETERVEPQLTRLLTFLKEQSDVGGPSGRDRAGAFGLMTAAGIHRELMRSNLQGLISTDGRVVYSIEDFSHLTWSAGLGFQPDPGERLPGNYLRATDLSTGQLLWQAGGLRGKGTVPNPLSGFYFHGPPLCIGKRVCVIGENSDGIQLLELEGSAANARVVRSQLLRIPEHLLTEHPVRRYAGLCPSQAGDLLICPTGDGHVAAVSAADFELRWMARYNTTITRQVLGGDAPVLIGARDTRQSAEVDLASRWTDELVRVSDQTVLITPRDADHLIALDAGTGEQRWRHPRGNARFVAHAADGLVILAGRDTLTALDISSGSPTWERHLTSGRVMGRCAGTADVLHVPVYPPAVITVASRTGMLLTERPLPDDRVPGNLYTTNDALLIAGVTDICRLSGPGLTTPTMEDPFVLQLAQQVESASADVGAEQGLLLAQALLLLGEQEEALSVLKTLMDAGVSADLPLLAAGTLINLLEADYGRFQSEIPYLRALMDRCTYSDADVAELLTMLMGVTPLDAVVLPDRISASNQMRDLQSRLFELEASRLGADSDDAVEALAGRLLTWIRRLPESRAAASQQGSLQRRLSAFLLGELHRQWTAAVPDVQTALTEQLGPRLQTMLTLADAEERTLLLKDLTAAGLFELILPWIQDVGIEEISRQSPDVADRLISEWMAAARDGNGTINDAVVNDYLAAIGRTDLIGERNAESQDNGGIYGIAPWPKPSGLYDLSDIDPVIPATAFNRNIVTVAVGDASDAVPPDKRRVAGAATNIPLIGPSGFFRGWSFQTEYPAGRMIATDSQGRRRWQLDLRSAVSESPVGPAPLNRYRQDATSVYLQACGSLLILKYDSVVVVLQTLKADQAGEPVVLWNRNLERLVEGSLDELSPWERLTLYAKLPDGLAPVGAPTRAGLPIVVAGRLYMLDLITGATVWTDRGLPDDALLLGGRNAVCVLSEEGRSLELRNPLSGDVMKTAQVPEWWEEANNNIGTTRLDVDIEDGEYVVWRVLVEGTTAVTLSLGTDDARLECRSLFSAERIWEHVLPANTVVSNPVDGIIAALSEESQLRLYQLDTGEEKTLVQIPNQPNVRNLYLRRSMNRWLVLPESLAAPSDDIFPPISSSHVNGRLTAIDARTGQEAWAVTMKNEYIRNLSPQHSPISPTSPVLPLLSRLRPPTDDAPGGPTIFGRVYGVRVLRVDSGEVLYESGDVGRDLSWFRLRVDGEQGEVQLGFNARNVTLQYQPPAEN